VQASVCCEVVKRKTENQRTKSHTRGTDLTFIRKNYRDKIVKVWRTRRWAKTFLTSADWK